MLVRTIETFPVNRIKDEQVPEIIHGFVGGREFIDGLMTNCPVVYTAPYAGNVLPFNDPGSGIYDIPPLRQLTPNHHRSYEVVDVALPEVWFDEYGKPFTSINLKGNNFSNPTVFESLTAPDGVLAYGLQESSVIRRVVRGSRMLAAAGISTERILGIAEPQFYPTSMIGPHVDVHQNMSLPQYKDFIIRKYWNAQPETERSADSLADLYRKFLGMTFYITARAMDTSYRLSELEESLQARHEVFAIANKLMKPDGVEPYDPQKNKDVVRYLKEVIIPKLAPQYAKIHALGFVQGFPTGLNNTALGSIVDLDSLRGEPLGMGDPPISAHDVIHDLTILMEGLDDSLPVAIKVEHDYFTSPEDEMYKELPSRQFISAYVAALVPLIDLAPFSLKDLFHEADRCRQVDNLDNDDLRVVNVLRAQDIYKALETLEIEVDEIAVLLYDFDDWLGRKGQALTEAIDNELDGITDSFIDIISAEFMNEIIAGDIDIIAKVTGYHNTAIEYLHDVFNELVAGTYLRTKYGITDEFSDIVAANMFRRARDVLMNQSVKADEIVSTLMDTFLRDRRKVLEERLKLTTMDSILDKEKYGIVPFSCSEGNLYATEAENVPLDAVLSGIENLAAVDVVVENFKLAGLKAFFDNNVNYELSDENARLIEVITDGHLSGFSSNAESKLSAIAMDTPLNNAAYIAYVELLPDDKKLVTIQLVNHTNVSGIKNFSKARLIEYLRNSYVRQSQLFSPGNNKTGTIKSVFEPQFLTLV